MAFTKEEIKAYWDGYNDGTANNIGNSSYFNNKVLEKSYRNGVMKGMMDAHKKIMKRNEKKGWW